MWFITYTGNILSYVHWPVLRHAEPAQVFAGLHFCGSWIFAIFEVFYADLPLNYFFLLIETFSV
jgi:hypothetical protein